MGMASLGWIHVFLFIAIVLVVTYLGERSNSRGLLAISCFIMICVSGLRHGYVDTRAYRYGFLNLDISQVFSTDFLLHGGNRDRGFSVLSAIIKTITSNDQVFIFVFAFITVGCLFYGLIKNTSDITFSVFLFITTGCFLDTMNGMRQAFVVAVMFAVLPKLVSERHFFKYLIVVLLLSTVHGTALLFIPLYFIVGKKAWSSSTRVVLAITLIAFSFFGLFSQVLFNILEGTSYSDDYGQMILMANTSVNVIRFFVAIVPLVMSFLDRKNPEKDFPMYDICFNMSLINAVVWLFATKVLYFYRLGAYFIPYMILLLCYEIHFLKPESYKKSVNMVATILFVIWHIYGLSVMGDQFFVGYLKY